MKTTKKTTATKGKKPSSADARSRKMEPLKSKELKNQRFDVDEDEQEQEIDPESIDENFKGFEESFDAFDDEEEDY